MSGRTEATLAGDGAVVTRCLEGDAGALEVLWTRYRGRLVALLTARTGDVGLAEDLTHETLLRATDHLASFDRSRPLWPWLARIASNLATDHARREGRMELSAEPAELGDPVAAPWSDTLCLRAELDQALAELPPRQRAALELTYLQDWDTPAVAAWFGVSPSAVKQLLFRARRSLRASLAASRRSTPAGIATPGLLRGMIQKVRARVAAWEATWQTSAPGLSATASAIVLATALTATPAPRPPPPAPSSITTPLGLHQSGPADLVRPLGGAAQEGRGEWPPAHATAATGAADDGAGDAGSRTLQHVSVTGPDGGPLGDPTDAEADVQRDEGERTVNARIRKHVPGTPVRTNLNGVVLWVSCSGTVSLLCDAIDALPAAEDPGIR